MSLSDVNVSVKLLSDVCREIAFCDEHLGELLAGAMDALVNYLCCNCEAHRAAMAANGIKNFVKHALIGQLHP